MTTSKTLHDDLTGMYIQTPEFRQIVVNTLPEGDVCGYCGEKNDNWDDCGWWWITDLRGERPAGETWRDRLEIPSKAACNSCYVGPIGQSHRAFYGTGER